MLQLKSFKISEGKEASDFLNTHMLHGKSNILVSDGQIMIPYEDGTPPTTTHLILGAKEDKNTMIDQMSPILHSQRVLEVDIKNVIQQMEDAKAKFLPITGDKKDKEADSLARRTNAPLQKEIDRLINVKTQKENQIIMNQAEITRFVTNIKVYDETIANLEAEQNANGSGEKTG